MLEMDCLQVFNALVDNFSNPKGFGLIIEEENSISHLLEDLRTSLPIQ